MLNGPRSARPGVPAGTEDALAALLDRPVTTARWGLERMGALLDELGHPESAWAAFHIAGTNGKGSTAAFAGAVLHAAGVDTGLYTSPHLSDARERFRVRGRPVAEAILQRCAARVAACRAADEATYFEVATALAFLCFAESGVTHAVVETGLGGRLDATNVLTPLATAITSIGLDHADLLGHTLVEVAREKAGILVPGCPVALGAIDADPRRVIEARAARLGAPVLRLGRDARIEDVAVDASGTRFRYRSARRPQGVAFRTSLIGAHQARNAGLALLMLEAAAPDPGLDDETVREGIASARVAGRFEIVEGRAERWILDVAHNEEGVAALLESARAVGPPRPWIGVVGILADKPWGAMLDALATELDAFVLAIPASAPPSRRWSLEAARERLEERGARAVVCEDGIAPGLGRAAELRDGGTVFVTGSTYTVGEARSALGVE